MNKHQQIDRLIAAIDGKAEHDGVPIMTPGDVSRLRADALPTTHLARYDAANALGARTVLDVRCPDCGVWVGAQCALLRPTLADPERGRETGRGREGVRGWALQSTM